MLQGSIRFMSAAPSLTRIPGWLVLMGLLTALGPLAIDMYLPAFPAIADGLGTDTAHVERTLGFYLLGLALAQMFYGPLADRFGRKPPLLVGLFVYAAASAGCAMSVNIEQLLFFRVLQSFGGAAGLVIPRAVIRDNFDTRDASKALSMVMLIMGATPILAPVLGGFLLEVGSWRLIFALIAICAGLLLVASALTMRETRDPGYVTPLSVASILRNYMLVSRDKSFLYYSLAGGMGSAGMFAYLSGSPRVFMDVMGVEARYVGVLIGLNAAALIFTSQVNSRLLNRHSPERLFHHAQVASMVMTLAGVVLTLLGMLDLITLTICVMGFMASRGFVNPNSTALALAHQGRRLGIASAMLGTLNMIFGAIAGIAVSAWQVPTALPLTGILAFCACASWFFGRQALRVSAVGSSSAGV